MSYDTEIASPRVECVHSAGQIEWSHNSFPTCKTCDDLTKAKHDDVEFLCKSKRDIVYRQECLAKCKTDKTLLATGSNSYIYVPPGMSSVA